MLVSLWIAVNGSKFIIIGLFSCVSQLICVQSCRSIFAIALMLSMTVMSIIDSAVSTVIVCFAEAPDELERNHQTHSREMKEAWHKVYPMIRF